MIPDDPVVFISLVVATLGRTDELERLFASIALWKRRDFEIIVVDQNHDDRLLSPIENWRGQMAIVHLRTKRPGVCRARNLGAKQAKGEWLLFPDDDCWYPPDLIETFEAATKTWNVDFLSGRAINDHGVTIMGRFPENTVSVERGNVWATLIEWMLFIRRSAFDMTSGFDDHIGPGSGTPWGAYEVQDLALRLLDKGATGRYAPALAGYHPDERLQATSDAARKMRAYGAGLGYVMRKHDYGIVDYLPHLLRPIAGVIVYTLTGRQARARRSREMLIGRWIGWRTAPTTTIF